MLLIPKPPGPEAAFAFPASVFPTQSTNSVLRTAFQPKEFVMFDFDVVTGPVPAPRNDKPEQETPMEGKAAE